MRPLKIAILAGLAIAAGVAFAAHPVSAPDGTVFDDALTAPTRDGATWVRVGLSVPVKLRPAEDGSLRLPALESSRLAILNAASGEPISAGSITWELPEVPSTLARATWRSSNGLVDLRCVGNERVRISAPDHAPAVHHLRVDGRTHTVLLRPVGALNVELQPPTEGRFWLAREDRINVANLFANVSDEHLIEPAGTLQVIDLDTSASYVGVVVAQGKVPIVSSFQQLPQTVTLRLDEGLGVGGQVFDEHGEPISGAEVEALGQISELDNFRYSQQAISDADGFFRLSGLLAGEARIRACARGRACAEVSVELAEDKDLQPLRLELVGGHDLLIVVENEVGEPVTGAMVFFDGRAHHTDARGHLEVGGVAPGQIIPVKIFGDGFGVWEGRFTTDPERVVLRVPGGGVIEQQVLAARSFDEDEVSVRWQKYSPQGREGKSGEGAWDAVHQIARASGLETGSYELIVRLPGMATHTSERVDVVPGDEVMLTPVVPERGLAITGRVLDAATFAPVAGAEVNCEPGSPTAFRRPHEIENLPSTTTDTDGVFLLEGLDPGSCRAIIRAAGFATWRRDGVTPDEWGFDIGDVEMDDGMTVVGRVTDRSDRPITGARVEITEAATYAYFPETTLRTDHDGWFRAERLSVGRWTVTAEHVQERARATVEGGSKETVTANLVIGGMQIEGEIWLGDSRASGGSLVLTTDASQATGVVVMFERVTAGRRFFGVDATPVQLPVSVEGLFAGTGIEPGRYYASYTPDDPGAAPVVQILEVPRVETFRCVLEYADAALEGVVVDMDSLPVPGASVLVASGDGGQGTTAFTDAEGGFAVRGLHPGRVTLTASHTGFGPSEPTEIELYDGRTEGPVVLELLAPDGAEIALSVEAASGSVGGAPVYLVGIDTATSFTDGSGLAIFSDVAAGLYRPCGIAYGGATGCGADLRVDDGDQMRASLELGHGGFVDVLFGIEKRLPAISVVTRDGVDLSSLLFMASPPQPLPGGLRLGPLQADDYLISVSTAGGPRQGSVSVRDGEPVELDLR